MSSSGNGQGHDCDVLDAGLPEATAELIDRYAMHFWGGSGWVVPPCAGGFFPFVFSAAGCPVNGLSAVGRPATVPGGPTTWCRPSHFLVRRPVGLSVINGYFRSGHQQSERSRHAHAPKAARDSWTASLRYPPPCLRRRLCEWPPLRRPRPAKTKTGASSSCNRSSTRALLGGPRLPHMSGGRTRPVAGGTQHAVITVPLPRAWQSVGNGKYQQWQQPQGGGPGRSTSFPGRRREFAA